MRDASNDNGVAAQTSRYRGSRISPGGALRCCVYHPPIGTGNLMPPFFRHSRRSSRHERVRIIKIKCRGSQCWSRPVPERLIPPVQIARQQVMLTLGMVTAFYRLKHDILVLADVAAITRKHVAENGGRLKPRWCFVCATSSIASSTTFSSLYFNQRMYQSFADCPCKIGGKISGLGDRFHKYKTTINSQFI